MCMLLCLLQHMTASCCLQIGHVQPVAWFRFHNRRDYRRWSALAAPKTLWEGKDSDFDIRRTRRAPSSRGASPEPSGNPTARPPMHCTG